MMLKPASETGIMFVGADETMVDRKQFVENLGWLLAQTREGVETAYLDDNDTVHVVLCKGGELRVNVHCDSYMAIIRDVAKALR